MIPSFDDTGCLPDGLYPATLAEIEERFGRASELRRAQMESIRWMIDLAKRAGAERIVLNGSFVTDIIEPNDVDCALLFAPNRPRDRKAVPELRSGLPFLDLKLVAPDEFQAYVNVIFRTDRIGMRKGLIEVIL